MKPWIFFSNEGCCWILHILTKRRGLLTLTYLTWQAAIDNLEIFYLLDQVVTSASRSEGKNENE